VLLGAQVYLAKFVLPLNVSGVPPVVVHPGGTAELCVLVLPTQPSKPPLANDYKAALACPQTARSAVASNGFAACLIQILVLI